MPYSYSNDPLYVSQGQTLRFRYKAPSSWDTTETVTIRIGLLEQYWFITTIPEDFAPDPFPLYSIKDVEPDTVYIYADGTRPGEDIILVSGLTPGTLASVSLSSTLDLDIANYAMRIKRNGQNDWEVRTGITDAEGWFIPTVDTVENGDRIQIRLRSSEFSATETSLTVTIGSGYETWNITTRYDPPNIPEPFPDFTDLFNIIPGSVVYSNILRVQGLTDVAIVNVDVGDAKIGISSSNAYTTNDDGYDMLSGVTFVDSSTNPTITNGQYLQLKFTTPNLNSVTTPIALSIGEKSNGSVWNVGNGIGLSTTPNSFVFTDVSDAPEDTPLISSDTKPLNGITGLGSGVEVDVVLLENTGTEPRIKITDDQGNESSIGLFPAKVKNGYKITIYNRSSATFGGDVTMKIKVGKTEIPTWTIVTNSGPDTDAVFSAPPNITNRPPSTSIGSALISVTGINRPIQINATNGALISIDFDTPVAGPRTFTPGVNSVFQLYLTTATGLNQTVSTQVTVGTGTTNNPFTWSVTTYAVAPPPKTNLGRWYSKKTDKFDGYSIGTILAITKEGDGTYGDLSGDLDSRYPGFIECDGSSYQASLYPDLWWVIGNTYGGNASYDTTNKTYSGTFKVPDYRNRKLTGTGVVDGNRGSSAFVPVSTVGKGIYDVGAEGGYWYIDSVDVSGPLPFEQIYGDAGASSGTTSPFFTFGTPSTLFTSPVTAETEFTVAGSVTGLVGPVSEVTVGAPAHTHFFITAVVESDTGSPVIPWGDRAFLGPLAQQGGNSYYSGFNQGPFGGPGQDEAALGGQAINPYIQKLTQEATLFKTEYDSLDPGKVSPLNDVISTLTRIQNSRNSLELNIETWYLSPESAIPDSALRLVNTTSAGTNYPASSLITTPVNAKACAVIDTRPATFRVDAYVSPDDGGVLATHSHYLTIFPVDNPLTDYSYGNESGPGTKNALGGSATSLNITFNQSEVQNTMNTGTFTLNQNIKKPVPNVAFVPNRKVPLVPAFHKVKYVIKAY